MDGNGTVIGKGAGFKEDLFVVDTDTWLGEIHGPIIEDDIAAVHDSLEMGVRDYAGKCGFKSAVLGLSGGNRLCLDRSPCGQRPGC